MIVNGKELNINELINDIDFDRSMIKMRGNGIYLSDNQIVILKRYGIDYTKYASFSSIIFDIEKTLNEETDIDDLEEVSARLSEINYYNNTKK